MRCAAPVGPGVRHRRGERRAGEYHEPVPGRRKSAWAQTSTGAARQPKVSLYVNTADPGRPGPPTGRRPTTTPSPASTSPTRTAAAPAETPRRAPGSTDGTWLTWMRRPAACQVPAATCGGSMSRRSTAGSPAPRTTAPTWRAWSPTSGTSAGPPASTPRPSNGTRSWAPSRLPARCTGLPDWIPGAKTLSQAKKNCQLAPLTRGGAVTVTQWRATVNSDLSCHS